ncbi:ComF family protein [Bacillus solitudinis]|uniref:ComF family protein n=1 Tax=Bacillus solitudinis TaxID=2014074 RepID=UPI000C238F3E|nr:ComF family protein [Bacillus solitudinis]
MIICLCCNERFAEKPTWRALFLHEPQARLCNRCEQQLCPVSEVACQICSRSLDKLSPEQYQDGICYDCLRWEKDERTKGLLERNVSLFEYNSFLKEWLTMYKFRGDAVIATYFASKLKKVYHEKFSEYLPVPIPLHEERLMERGFNQAELFMKGWAEPYPLLVRQLDSKQSKKTRQERVQQVLAPVFSLNREVILPKSNIVLIDDIYTTGTTLRQAAVTLKKFGISKVASITVARA